MSLEILHVMSDFKRQLTVKHIHARIEKDGSYPMIT